MSQTISENTSKELGSAKIEFDGSNLTVSTGTMTRFWKWTGKGFRTTRLEHINHKREWVRLEKNDLEADWLLPVVQEKMPEAHLTNTNIEVSDDEGFTTQHLSFQADMEYSELNISLRYVIWAFPNSPGLRTSIFIRALEGFVWHHQIDRIYNTEEVNAASGLQRGYQRLENLPIDFSNTTRHKIGHYADTQNRNDPHLAILLEEKESHPLTHPTACEWANAIAVDRDGDGVVLLKESHRCVNTRGHDTGTFLCLPDSGLENHGWGIFPQEIDEEWRPAWATWTILYQGGRRERMTAIKAFDLLRYPVKPNDIYLQANTWGSSRGYLEHRDAAGEENVLKEIESCADLGLDVLQIDDGWQGNQLKTWFTDKKRYPHGWAKVRQKAKEAGIKLGLWLAAEPPSLEDLHRNAEEGNFVSFKLDFASLSSRKKIDALMNKSRRFVKEREHKVRINWDLTEVCPRYGYYYAREFGSIYLENRKPQIPRTVTYRPGNVLKDLWDLSHFCNLLKFQGSVQNLAMVDRKYSDAAAYRQDYCVAIPLMSNPLFFCETHYFDESVRKEIRPLLKAYKAVREDIRTGMIHPVGKRPDGCQITGFECEKEKNERQFLLLFREPWNEEPKGNIYLPHLSGALLRFENLMNGTFWEEKVNEQGNLSVQIDQAGDFRFMAFTVL